MINGKLRSSAPTARTRGRARRMAQRASTPATDKWTKKTDIPMPVHHQAMTGYNGKMYVFGGGVKISPTSDNRYPTNRVWDYTPATNPWRELGPMPTKRGGGIALVLNNKIYVIGGAAYHPLQTDDVSISMRMSRTARREHRRGIRSGDGHVGNEGVDAGAAQPSPPAASSTARFT